MGQLKLARALPTPTIFSREVLGSSRPSVQLTPDEVVSFELIDVTGLLSY